MARLDGLEKRIGTLEARQALSDALGGRWPPMACDPARRLARCTAYFEGLPWDCTGTPAQKVRRENKLAGYKRYFDELDAGVAAPRWDQ